MWNLLASKIHDKENNANNRFVVASELNRAVGQTVFWGHPTNQHQQAEHLSHLPPTRPENRTVNEYRLVEKRLQKMGRRPFSAWQLFGNGSVGSQALVGIPRIVELRKNKCLQGVVWPFETGLSLPDRNDETRVVWVEIWPGCIPVDPTLHEIRDAAQMLGYVRWAAREDVEGRLQSYFKVTDISDKEEATVVTTEGWILGFLPTPSASSSPSTSPQR
jgi:hypothetical protein